MESKPRFYIYEKKEIAILIVLGVAVAVFSFTLGVHLGKHVPASRHETASSVSTAVQTLPDQAPPSEELSEQAPRAAANVEEFMTESLKKEVVDTGATLKQKIQVDLPEKKKALVVAPETLSKPAAAASAHSSKGRYAIQVGSYPSAEEADAQQKILNEKGLHAVVRAIDLKGKGRRYRLLIEGFATQEEADHEGRRYVSEQKVSAFVVTSQGQ